MNSEELKKKGPAKRSPELSAMAKIEQVLESLSPPERCRVLSYVKEKFNATSESAVNCLGSNTMQL